MAVLGGGLVMMGGEEEGLKTIHCGRACRLVLP